jgi:GxxExxY protein
MEFEKLSNEVIGCAIEVHKNLGPGLLEPTYEECLLFELKKMNKHIDRQLKIPVKYKNMIINCGYRLDLLVENKLIVEIKAIEKLDKIHTAQILTYMRLSLISVGLLINFNEVVLKNGIKRLVI